MMKSPSPWTPQQWPVYVLIITTISSIVLSKILPVAQSIGPGRREIITSRHGAVATDDGRCSRIGRNVLREGGHAVDATVAAVLCLGVVSAASSGLGGGPLT
ncbi:hypothetical protein Syun_003984 [Stephania yunnanensis]|uniref:Uncharacterized protein n=1 Tax=Stephania yunnanensis TaxID=152371 RepID=A0AAP0L3P5_9MAGN